MTKLDARDCDNGGRRCWVGRGGLVDGELHTFKGIRMLAAFITVSDTFWHLHSLFFLC